MFTPVTTTDATSDFDEWLAYAFDTSMRESEERRMDADPEWNVDWRGDWLKECRTRYPLYYYAHAPIDEKAEFYTQFFAAPGRWTARYGDRDLVTGLNRLLNGSHTNDLYSLFDASRLRDHQIAVLEGIKALYSDVFLPRCNNDRLGHLNEPGSALDGFCYMFWDACALDSVAMRSGLLDYALAAMRHGLSLPSAACQESALHGLGHGVCLYGEQPHRIIKDYMQRPDEAFARPELKAYAEQALTGDIL